MLVTRQQSSRTIIKGSWSVTLAPYRSTPPAAMPSSMAWCRQPLPGYRQHNEWERDWARGSPPADITSVSHNTSNGNGGGGINVAVLTASTTAPVAWSPATPPMTTGLSGSGLVSQHRDEQQIVGKRFELRPHRAGVPNQEQQLASMDIGIDPAEGHRVSRYPPTPDRSYGASAAFLISSTSGAAWGLLAVPRIRMSRVETSLPKYAVLSAPRGATTAPSTEMPP